MVFDNNEAIITQDSQSIGQCFNKSDDLKMESEVTLRDEIQDAKLCINMQYDAVSIEKLGLRVRSYNALMRNGIDTVGKLRVMSDADLSSIKNFGKMCIDDVHKCLSDLFNTNAFLDATLSGPSTEIMFSWDMQDNSLIKKFTDLLYADINDLHIVIVYYDVIFNVLMRWKGLITAKSFLYKNSVQFLSDRNVMSLIYSDKNFKNAVCLIIESVMSLSPIGFTSDELKSYLPKSCLSSNSYDICINALMSEGKIEFYNGKYMLCHESIVSYITSTYNEYKSQIILDRLSGLTLEEVARKSCNLTRERVRQIVASCLATRPVVDEDKYKYWFEKYDLSKSVFCEVFDVDCVTYNYLNHVYDRGQLKLSDLLNDDCLTDTIKENAMLILNANKIEMFGHMVDCNRNTILANLMEYEYSSIHVSIDALFEEYNQFCEDNELYDLKEENVHIIESRITDKMYILASWPRLLRYYDMESKDLKSFFEQISFSKYIGSVISAAKIFNDYPDLMTMYDIRSGYELHNLIRKNLKLVPSYVEVTRMPYLNIGNVSRDAQIRNSLYRVMPISQADFVKVFSNETGIDQGTILANWIEYVSDFYHDGMYQI